jgi:hypothetical protein
VLPIEFSRVSQDERLTLVIDSENGVPVPTRFVASDLLSSAASIANLGEREGMQAPFRRIGYVDLVSGAARLDRVDSQIMWQWAGTHGFDAVIWTDLASNFEERTGNRFTIEAALEHLQRLSPDQLARALEYFRRAPPEVITPLRCAVIAP